MSTKKKNPPPLFYVKGHAPTSFFQHKMKRVQRKGGAIMACCSDYNGYSYSNNTAQQWLIWIVLILAALYFYRYTMCQ